MVFTLAVLRLHFLSIRVQNELLALSTKYTINHTLVMLGPIDAKEKGHTLNRWWVKCATSYIHLTHDHNLGLLRWDFELSVSLASECRLTWDEANVTGATMQS